MRATPAVRRALPAGVLVVGLVLLGGGEALAQDVVATAAGPAPGPRLALSWRAPTGCPTGARVESAALASAGGPGLPDGATPTLVAEAQVARGARWSVVLRTSRGTETARERRLEAASCDALADATAVILSTALLSSSSRSASPSATATSAGPDATEAPPSTEAAAPEPAPPRDPAPTPPAPSSGSDAREATAGGERDRRAGEDPGRHAIAGSASFATDGANLPSPAVGGRVALAWTPGRARLEAAGALYSAQSQTDGAASAAGARFTLVGLSGRGCWALLDGVVQVSPCAGVDLAHVTAAGFGAAQNHDRSATWLAVAGGGLVRVPLAGWLALRADADARVPLSRPEFVVEGGGSVHRPAPIGLRAAIGAEIAFF